MSSSQQTNEIALTLSLEDADALCVVLAEQIELASQADDGGEYLHLASQVRNELIAAMTAAHEAESFSLSLAPTEAVCLFLLVSDALADFDEIAAPAAALDLDQALGLTHDAFTVAHAQSL